MFFDVKGTCGTPHMRGEKRKLELPVEQPTEEEAKIIFKTFITRKIRSYLKKTQQKLPVEHPKEKERRGSRKSYLWNTQKKRREEEAGKVWNLQ